jgi:hypothetical protein
LHISSENPVSKFAFKCNLHRYTVERCVPEVGVAKSSFAAAATWGGAGGVETGVGRCRLNQVDP